MKVGHGDLTYDNKTTGRAVQVLSEVSKMATRLRRTRIQIGNKYE
jgi:hypothetical protein